MEKNIVNVYRYCDANNDCFIYSVKNNNKLLGYSYFMITNINNKPTITKLENAIAFLQSNGLKIKAIKQDDPDYEEFITLFSTFIKESIDYQPIRLQIKHKLTKRPLHFQKK